MQGCISVIASTPFNPPVCAQPLTPHTLAHTSPPTYIGWHQGGVGRRAAHGAVFRAPALHAPAPAARDPAPLQAHGEGAAHAEGTGVCVAAVLVDAPAWQVGVRGGWGEVGLQHA